MESSLSIIFKKEQEDYSAEVKGKNMKIEFFYKDCIIQSNFYNEYYDSN